MKFILILLLFAVKNTQSNNAKGISSVLHKSEYVVLDDLPDGRYKSVVEYYNNATYTKATYRLVVGVTYGKVASIEFGNGGSVHSGYNNEGYYYSGGTLYAEKDYQGNIISYSGTVTITDSDGIRTFKITIS